MSVPLAYIGVIIIWSTTPLAIKWSGGDAGFLFGVTARMLIGLLFSLSKEVFGFGLVCWFIRLVKARRRSARGRVL